MKERQNEHIGNMEELRSKFPEEKEFIKSLNDKYL
jgi:hypothetical protein